MKLGGLVHGHLRVQACPIRGLAKQVSHEDLEVFINEMA
jgi:hypothetical protein